jgi:hypothetical protein
MAIGDVTLIDRDSANVVFIEKAAVTKGVGLIRSAYPLSNPEEPMLLTMAQEEVGKASTGIVKRSVFRLDETVMASDGLTSSVMSTYLINVHNVRFASELATRFWNHWCLLTSRFTTEDIYKLWIAGLNR